MKKSLQPSQGGLHKMKEVGAAWMKAAQASKAMKTLINTDFLIKVYQFTHKSINSTKTF